MKIILMVIIKNILEKKLRSFLIIFSIALSCAFFFSTGSFGDTFIRMFKEKIKQYYGTSHILIEPGSRSPSGSFTLSKTKVIEEEAEYIIGHIWSSGSYRISKYENRPLLIRGLSYEDFGKLSDLTLIDSKDLLPFKGNKIIIDSNFARQYSVGTGQTITIKIGTVKYKFVVAAVVLAAGIMASNPQQSTMIVPRKKLARIYGIEGRVTMGLIKLKKQANIERTIDRLAKSYNRYSVREPVNPREIREQLRGIVVSFQIMTLIILSISVFIIYSSFKVIVIERIPVLGTLRSIGATKHTSNMILLLESCIYGITGGIAGVILGVLFLYAMAYIMSNNGPEGRLKIILYIGPFKIMLTLLTALILSIVSSALPILKISGIPIKEIILNQFEQKTAVHTPGKTAAGFICLILSLVIPSLKVLQKAFILHIAALILLVTGIIVIIPFIIKACTAGLEKAYVFIFGNEGIIAVKNLNENKNIHNTISLLAIGLAGVLMINIISYSLESESANPFRASRFDIWLKMDDANRNSELLIRSVGGVKNTYGIYEAENIEIIREDQKIGLLNGIDAKYLRFWDCGLEKSQIDELNQGRCILLSLTLKKILEVRQGDFLTLKMNRGRRRYKITGFFNSDRNNGSHALIARRFYKMDMNSVYYDTIYIQTKHDVQTGTVVQGLQYKFFQRNPWILTTADMIAGEAQSNSQILLILKTISYLTLLIGAIGVVNNLAINFIQRKRPLAMFRSIGMSKVQVIKMLFIESLSGGIIGSLTGIAAGFGFIFIVKLILRNLVVDLEIHYSPALFIYSAAAGAVITIAATISPAIKITKLNIIDTIKYE